MTTKALGFTYLTHVDLGNHNAGEGGSQLSDLKKVGSRPYISGQAYRHAIKDALGQVVDDPQDVDCSPQYACGDIGTCKMCDLFGYMNTDLGDDAPPKKRYSPLRVTPLVGQYDRPLTTDMILQYDPDEAADHNIGYREMTENVFRGALMLDVSEIGRREIESVDSSSDHDEVYHRRFDEEIDATERAKRVRELIDAISHTTRLAGQARHMADFMPDLCIGATLGQYNQRLTNAIHVDSESGECDVTALTSVLRDLDQGGTEVFVGGTYNPQVLQNWEEVMDGIDQLPHVTTFDSVTECFEAVKENAEVAETDA